VKEPYQKAVDSVRDGKRQQARKFLADVSQGLLAFRNQTQETDPGLSSKLNEEIIVLRQVYLELKPRPVAKIADEMQNEAKVVNEIGTELLFTTRK
jgi:hypothetical protein